MKIIISFFSAHAVQNEFSFNLLLLLVVVFGVSNLIVVVYAVVKTNRFLLTGYLKTHVENFPRSENFYYLNSVIVRISKSLRTRLTISSEKGSPRKWVVKKKVHFKLDHFKNGSFRNQKPWKKVTFEEWVTPNIGYLEKKVRKIGRNQTFRKGVIWKSLRKMGHFEIDHFGKIGHFGNGSYRNQQPWKRSNLYKSLLRIRVNSEKGHFEINLFREGSFENHFGKWVTSKSITSRMGHFGKWSVRLQVSRGDCFPKLWSFFKVTNSLNVIDFEVHLIFLKTPNCYGPNISKEAFIF